MFPALPASNFLYNLSRSSYREELGLYLSLGRGSGRKILATLFRVMPKVGPLRPLAFERLTPETEKMYMASFNSTIDRYRALLVGTECRPS
jgi:hypothetical protein